MIDPAGTLIVTLHTAGVRDKSPLHMISAARLAQLELAEIQLSAARAKIVHLALILLVFLLVLPMLYCKSS